MTPFVVAIDGPAASGKGTLARRLAASLGLPHLDTGLLYRGTARLLLNDSPRAADPDMTTSGAGNPEAGLLEAGALRAAQRLVPADLHRTDLRTPAIDRLASRISALPAIRAALLDTQRGFARTGGVLDGRDIGTVVVPDAALKLFVTASPSIRALRRLLQRHPGTAPSDHEILEERLVIEARDRADEQRSAAPLARAADAILLDTTLLDPDEVFAAAIGHANAARARSDASR